MDINSHGTKTVDEYETSQRLRGLQPHCLQRESSL
jgi:hypothetical protein